MSLASLESLLRRAINHCGFDLTRYRPEASEAGRLARMLQHNEVNLVIDVGANVGQYARRLRQAGYAGRILSFEPLLEAHARLLALSRNDPHWTVGPRVAIGDREHEVELHISGNSVSSSVLEMLDSHIAAAPGSEYVATERVSMATLDGLLREHLHKDVRPFLKVDTQGFEDRVLAGASAVLAQARGVQLELSLVSLYEGQQLFEPLMDHLSRTGFSVWAIWPGFCDAATGRMLQVDAVFFRS
ncbi:MAG TPA: FkbM family methyltransferase [Xanthomonadaceae bacterium]|nr:FkbM family methyltransferase [Xanthomonadaceae bacterium]